MACRWTRAAQSDLARIHAFHAPFGEATAARRVRAVLAGVRKLGEHPRIGQALSEFDPREVRRIVVADFEVRYEIRGADVFVLRVWHVREDR